MKTLLKKYECNKVTTQNHDIYISIIQLQLVSSLWSALGLVCTVKNTITNMELGDLEYLLPVCIRLL